MTWAEGRAKIKTANQEERLHKRKEHFKNLLGNPPETTEKTIQRIIYDRLDITLGRITGKDLTQY